MYTMNQKPELPREWSNKSELLRLANHDFCFSLYAELAKNNTENMVFSPFSIHVIMFMTSIGADSKTFDELVASMHINKNDHSLDAYQEILEYLSSNNNILKLATGMFFDASLEIKKSFVDNSEIYLNSTVEKLNFKNNPDAQRHHINEWMSHKTMNKINELIAADSINSRTALILANAVHFKCEWKHEFTDAHIGHFYLTPEKKITVKMMNLNECMLYLPYYHNDEFKFEALELPYKHGNFKMTILLPDEKDGLKNLEDNLSKINLNEISKNMTSCNVRVHLPSFKLENNFKLKENLIKLGCPTMFTPSANFTNITDEDELLYVTDVVHKAYINVDEKGTEAAVATYGHVLFGSALGTIYFTADHPFIFYVSSEYQDLLYFGRIKELPICNEIPSNRKEIVFRRVWNAQWR